MPKTELLSENQLWFVGISSRPEQKLGPVIRQARKLGPHNRTSHSFHLITEGVLPVLQYHGVHPVVSHCWQIVSFKGVLSEKRLTPS